MTDKYAPPFGAYVDVTDIVSANAQTEITAAFAVLDTFLSPVEGQSMPHPDFDRIPPHTAQLLRDELTGLRAAIAAAPTA